MKFKKAIQELKGYIRDYAEEMLTKSKSKNQYECIFCGSGTGSNGTGALTIYENSFYCFSCRKSGDIFDLIQQAEGIPKNEVVQYAADKYGINLDNSAEREENADYTSFYREPKITAITADTKIDNSYFKDFLSCKGYKKNY